VNSIIKSGSHLVKVENCMQPDENGSAIDTPTRMTDSTLDRDTDAFPFSEVGGKCVTGVVCFVENTATSSTRDMDTLIFMSDM
jgi:hypothetical protein